MEGGDMSKVAPKRRKKVPFGVGFDSGDDEPIGSFLKLKNMKNLKRVKAGVAGGDKGKGVEKVVGGGEDLDGMDDTLASFRKKLKGPKKDGGGFSGKVLSSGVAEPSEKFGYGCDMDVDVGKELVSKDVGRGKGNECSESDCIAKSSEKSKKKSKPFKVSIVPKMIGNEYQPGNILSGRKTGDILLPSENEADVNPLDDTLDDSLSGFFHKLQSGLIRKVQSCLKAKEERVTQAPIVRLISSSSGAFEGPPDKSNPDVDDKKLTSSELRKGSDGRDSDQHEKEQSRYLNYDRTFPLPYHITEDLNNVAANMPKKDSPLADGRFSKPSVLGISKSELADLVENHANSFETIDNNYNEEVELKDSVNLTGRNGYASFQIPSELSTGVCRPNDEDAYADESSSPQTPCHPDSCVDISEYTLKHESKDNNMSDQPRAARKPKKRRHRDMAYEGDADWEILLHGQDDFAFKHLEEREHSFGLSKRTTNSYLCSEAEASAAVSVGLKACAVGPVEKVKFKEVLKHKGGLQDYLECRNHILSLWNKDVSRILPLSDCGVNEDASIDEFTHSSLVRGVYTFLDQHGYINSGVASWKEKAEFGDTHDLKLFEGNFGGRTGASLVDAEDGVSFILGNVKTSSNVIDKCGISSDVEKGAGKSEAVGEDLGQTLHLSSPAELQDHTTNAFQKHGHNDMEASKGNVNSDSAHSISVSKDEGLLFDVAPPDTFSTDTIKLDGATPILHSGSPKSSSFLQSTAVDSASHGMQIDSETKRKIIIIGAGPAGLTAARHLKRQGFSVDVLEARSRIGGRVFTDHSSLSVPVDLGASIITGVEADVATERRADPSSLVCAQLGLELTVLNSDCPLYDTVSGQKVPADLDDELEAEYNSLLDDMILLVAQKGEHAMRMSLEEGLEYALNMRCMAHSEKDLKSIDVVKSSEKFSNNGVPKNLISTPATLSRLERRVMDWHFANLEYGCAALLKEVSLPYWNQDDEFGGFGGAHCMVKGGYGAITESLAGGLYIHLNHIVTDISYGSNCSMSNDDQSLKVKVLTSNGREFSGDAVLVTVPLGCLKAGRIKFSPPLPRWKSLSIERLGFGVLNKVVLEFSEVFWDENIDYFGATAEETDLRGQCFMFWNVKKTVGAPVLIALLVGKAAIDEKMNSADHVNHALVVLRKLFGENLVPDPVASVVTDWGRDPYSYGAYSYVAVGSSGEDYDILGRPVENCLFFAGEATCKEHPDTVGGAMMSGLREAVRIMDILNTGVDHSAEIEAEESAERHSDVERNEVRDIITRIEALELSNVLCRNSLDQAKILTREGLLRDMFYKAKTTAGRLHLIKALLNLPVNVLKSFAGTRKGLGTLNSWILDSMGKDGTQLLRHCVRLLVRVSTDLLAVRLSGIGKTVKEKVCVHTSRDIRAIASQLVNVWVEVFRKEKASLRSKTYLASGKPPLRIHNNAPDHNRTQKVYPPAGIHLPVNPTTRKECNKSAKLERTDSKSEVKSSSSQGSGGKRNTTGDDSQEFPISEEEKAAFTEAEAARAAALAAAEAYASGAKLTMPQPLPKIPSFHKFARREQYARMDESDIRRNWHAGKQDCLSEIDSRNCRVRDWSVDFSAAGVNLESSRKPVDNRSQHSYSNDMASQMNFREHSGESVPVDSSLLTKAWVDSSGSIDGKDYNAIERWQCQAAAANFEFNHRSIDVIDEEDSNMSSKLPSSRHKPFVSESSSSQVTMNKQRVDNQERGADRIKQGVVDYVASLLMPLYKARKIDKDGYKSIMKRTATKVMESTTDAEKTMMVVEFLDSKRKTKIRAFVDTLIERHMSMKPSGMS
ncbi:hypothetical protein Leryth_021789 [Lithospermum erythrorhizon]|nr:hypothetical protein Leryth_021789 [Lithospermum erythrorhizon]